MSALARILLQKGAKVTGSDLSISKITQELIALGVEVYPNHSAEWIAAQEAIVYSSAVSCENPEFQEAQSKKLSILHRADLLAQLMEDYAPLLVAGSHGKTTTSALLAHLCIAAGLDPSYAVGGSSHNLGYHGHHGKGLYFVAEADESDGSFLKYSGFGAILTNLDNDHLDYWKSQEALGHGFRSFAAQVRSKEHLFFCQDDPALVALQLPGISYGFSKASDLVIQDYRQEGFSSVFTLAFKGELYPEIRIPLMGRHNALNAAAVFGLGLQLKLSNEQIRSAFASFSGVLRRAEKVGEVQEVMVYDDYAHHPAEIATTLQAFQQAADGRRLVLLFQPHRYSRTRDCLEEFASVFGAADQLIVTDIYGAGEIPIPGITTELLCQKIRAEKELTYVPYKELVAHLKTVLQPHDLLVTMGAGDVWKIGTEIVTQLQKSPLKQMRMALLFGGASTEHDVSVSSAEYVRRYLDSKIYQVEPFFIRKNGTFERSLEELQACDMAFPVLHGSFGEDGAMQGFLEILGLPYTGCDFRASPICMDKALAKHLAARHGILVAPFIDFSAKEWEREQEGIVEKICATLKFPLFTKGVHLGSSIGVRKVRTVEELVEGIEYALSFDWKVLVEEEVVGREIEFALCGGDPLFVSDPCEIQKSGDLHTYATKYGETAVDSVMRADLGAETIALGKEFVKKLYKIFGCDGFARIDCFLEVTGSIVFNEINPIPGLTPTSAYPEMLAAEGIVPADFLNRLVRLGLARKRADERRFKDCRG